MTSHLLLRRTDNYGEENTDTIFSPLYNAVLFFVGNVKYNGDMIAAQLQYYDWDPVAPALPGTYLAAVPNGRWRVSNISYGSIEARGNPRSRRPMEMLPTVPRIQIQISAPVSSTE